MASAQQVVCAHIMAAGHPSRIPEAVSKDGRWRVDLIRLTATSGRRDGEWLRVHCDGFFLAEIWTTAELATLVDLVELEEA